MSTHEEIERKYDVDERTVLPTLVGIDGVHAMGQAAEHHLDAVYYDTAGRDLLRHGATLRRRSGGSDAGWHLKTPGSEDARVELRQPLEDEHPPGDAGPERRGTSERHQVPPGLLDPVRAIVRDRALEPVMRIRTRRLEHAVLAADGAVLAQLCDDHVTAEALDGSAPLQSWREWEVELVDGPRTLLAEVEERLLEAGAKRATTASKLARSLGSGPGPGSLPEPDPAAQPDLRTGTVLEVIRADLSRRSAALKEHDRGVRAGKASSVHRMRIAARRLRAVLTSCGPLLEASSTAHLREDLRWIGQALAGARDAQVLHERLARTLDAEPPELVLGSVRVRLDEDLGRRQVAGLQGARDALDSERYFRLLDALDEVADRPPVTADPAAARASQVLPRLLARDGKRLRRAVAAAEGAVPGTARDAALHEARKKAKRLRYAAQFAEPVLGGRAHTLASRAKSAQQALGSHQDCVVARQVLRELGVRAHLDGENAFTFGRLHALEQWQAERAEEEFWRTWRRLPHRGIRRWLSE